MSAQTTLAPSAAKRRAVARPIPLPAPVITATLPASRPAGALIGYSFVEMKTFLVSVNASGASGPSSRPRPEDL